MVKTITVLQGDFAVSADPDAVLSTVLGSCVAVCLFDPGLRVGGMNHFLLAGDGGEGPDDLKYGVNAMELLINQLLRAGAHRRSLQAKLFGGARMSAHFNDIGARNSEFARSFLDREGIPCLSHSLGGTQARRVQFFPTSGDARQLQVAGDLPPVQPPKRPASPSAGVELF